MIDSKNVVYPMTVRDLVQSAVILGARKRGDGVEMLALEVLDVNAVEGSTRLTVAVRDQVGGERGELVLEQATPLLVWDIRRV